MPTGRAVTLTLTALLIYFFANQTQVGWLYVTSALVFGVVLAAWGVSRVALRGLHIERTVGDGPLAELHEGETVPVSLTLRAAQRRLPAAQLELVEANPLAAPDGPHALQRVFVPQVPPRGAVTLAYDVELDRRGLYTFPPLSVASRAPFGLFPRRGTLPDGTRALVFPVERVPRRLPLLDKQPAAQLVSARPGLGGEVLGVRPYRPGDSPRHVHWRSTARTGQLVSKEFADETNPGLALVFERHCPPTAHVKHNPFEWAVRCAASVGAYAHRHGYPLHLFLTDGDLSAPNGSASHDALRQLLARITPTPGPGLAALLARGVGQRYAVVVLPWATADAVPPLLALAGAGVNVLAVLPNPATFPGDGPDVSGIAAALRAGGVEACVMAYGDDWAERLAADEPVLH